ncbi:Uncharacterized protein FWK35_00035089, partial [Aphis craccivora]
THFRKCVALVVREYVAHEKNLTVNQVTPGHIIDYCSSTKEMRSDFIQCIYYALCGVEAITTKAKQTVLYWLRFPHTINLILFNEGEANNKNLGGDLGDYPQYDPQKKWVTLWVHQVFLPSEETLSSITEVLFKFQNPRYPNFNLPKSPKSKKMRRKPINIAPIDNQEQRAIEYHSSPLPGPSHSSPLPGPSHSSPLPGPSHSSPLPGPSHSSPLPGPSHSSPLPSPSHSPLPGPSAVSPHHHH